MAIIEDYGAIAKRLRELAPELADRGPREIDELEKWRHRAEETARVYVQSRRRDILNDLTSQKPFRHVPRS
jgi:hypothetical protein